MSALLQALLQVYNFYLKYFLLLQKTNKIKQYHSLHFLIIDLKNILESFFNTARR